MDISQIEGLSTKEVLAKQKKFGYNDLPNKDKKNILKLVFGLITEPMIFLLLSTVAIYFTIGDRGEAFLLLLSVFGIINIELYQNRKTEKSLEALRNLSSPISDVIRDGIKKVVPGRNLVVGDIILISEGSRIPADAKLISATNLEVDESLLTGESVAVEKHTREIKDFRVNSIFSGTLVVKGHGIAEVTDIGKDTEIGKIGTSLKSIKTEQTLLQKEVNKIIKVVASLAIGASALLVLAYWLTRGDFVQGLLAGLTLAIAILPEEFPIVLTVFLALGAWRLAKNNVLARRAHTIETLGSATVLCVDKTGTLTENQMEILVVVDSSGNTYDDNLHGANEIIKYGVLSSQKRPFDPMEEAFIAAGKQAFGNIEKIYNEQTIIKEYPLEENSLSVVYAWGKNNAVKTVALKGAPETVFDLCHLGKSEQEGLNKRVKELATQGLRVIAVAKAKNNLSIRGNRHDFDFELVGLVGLADPIRKEVPAAINICKDAGIKVMMITGDHLETAQHIAKQVGLNCDRIITGAEFEELSEIKRREAIKSISVFCRVTPAHKLIIVNTLKETGEVVAMTGDGVNDAPALKSAHIGIAMGKKGTDVAREAAAIVLLDDNFTSIVSGIRLGRRIYDNLQKAVSYIVTIHIPIALLSLMPVILGWPIVLIPAHIVFLEFIIDPSCTLVFESEREEANIMKRLPRKISESIFSRTMLIRSIIQGAFVSVIVVLAFKLLLNMGWVQDKARAMVFLILVVANISLIFGISGKKAVADTFHHKNNAMLTIFLLTSASLILLYSVPSLQNLFRFNSLSISESIVGVSIGALSIFGIIPLRNYAKRFLDT